VHWIEDHNGKERKKRTWKNSTSDTEYAGMRIEDRRAHRIGEAVADANMPPEA